MSIVDKMIEKDYQNDLLEQYERETGKEPVPEDGGHTDDFERWFVEKCEEAEKNGCKDAESALDYIKANEVRFFEVDFGDDTEAERICIKYRGDLLTVEEASKFCKKDEERIGHKVTAVYPIARSEADGLYDFSREDKWPVFPLDNEKEM